MLTFSLVLTCPTRIISQIFISAATPATVNVIGKIIFSPGYVKIIGGL